MNKTNERIQPKNGSTKVHAKSRCAGSGSKTYAGSIYHQGDNNFNVNRSGVVRRRNSK